MNNGYKAEGAAPTSAEKIVKAKRYALAATVKQRESKIYWSGVRAVFGLTPSELKAVRA